MRLNMDTSPEDGALIGLSTIGPGNFFKLPGTIVGDGGTEQAARSFDKETLDGLVLRGLAVFDKKWQGYALSKAGAKRVMEIMLLENPLEPIPAMEALVKFGASIGIQKAEDEQFRVNVVMAGTAYVAVHKDLGEAVRIVKKSIDKRLIES